jgi:hypothetical protein
VPEVSFNNARMKAMIDAEVAGTAISGVAAHAYIGYAWDNAGTPTEIPTSELARTVVATTLGGWTAPAAADPYIVANTGAGDSAVFSGSTTRTVKYWATFAAATGGSPLSTWIPTTDPDAVLTTNGKLSHAAGSMVLVNADRTTPTS